MKILPVYFALFLSSASAYLPSTPGSHESNQILSSPKPKESLQDVASHGMLGETNDLMKRLSLGSDYAVATSKNDNAVEEVDVKEEEVPVVVAQEPTPAVPEMELKEPSLPADVNVEEEAKAMIAGLEQLELEILAKQEQMEREILEELKEIKNLQEEASEIVAHQQQESSLQEQIMPTKKQIKLTIVEDETEEEQAEDLLEPIVTGWDEAEDDEEEEVIEEPTPTEMETEHATVAAAAPIAQVPETQPDFRDELETIQDEELPLPYSPYSRQQMVGFSAVDDFSAKFDEKLPRRLVNSYRLNADGRRVNTRAPAFVARTAHPNAQAPDQAPSAIGNENIMEGDAVQGGLAPASALRQAAAAPRIGYLPHEYSSESWFDNKSKVTKAVYGLKKKEQKVETPEQQETPAALEAAEEVRESVHMATPPPPPPQPTSNWFDNQSKVTNAMYNCGGGSSDHHEQSLQEKNRNAIDGQSAYFSNRYSYDNWHDNPKSNNLFLRYGHIE